MSKLIQSAANPEIKNLAKLIAKKSHRHLKNQIIVEGIHLLQTFIEAAIPLIKIYIPKHCYDQKEIQILLSKIEGDKIVYVEDEILHRISSLHNADEPTAVFLRPNQPSALPKKDVVILEDIQDPGNVGTILRSSAATGITDIVLSQHCADVWSPKVLRSAMGAHVFLQFYEVTEIAQWCQQYKYPIYATVLDSSAQNLYTLSLTTPAAWIFGNEGTGISETTRQAIQNHVIIPMIGSTESLNVAMAASICLFEQQRQRLSYK